jgi:hypothetical protein
VQNRATALEEAKNSALTQLVKRGKTAALNALIKALHAHPELRNHPQVERARDLHEFNALETKEAVEQFIKSLQ